MTHVLLLNSEFPPRKKHICDNDVEGDDSEEDNDNDNADDVGEDDDENESNDNALQ